MSVEWRMSSWLVYSLWLLDVKEQSVIYGFLLTEYGGKITLPRIVATSELPQCRIPNARLSAVLISLDPIPCSKGTFVPSSRCS